MLSGFADGLHARLNRIALPDDHFVATLREPLSRLSGAVASAAEDAGRFASGIAGSGGEAAAALVQLAVKTTELSGSMDLVRQDALDQHGLLTAAREKLAGINHISDAIADLCRIVAEAGGQMRLQGKALAELGANTANMAAMQVTLKELLDGHATLSHRLSAKVERLEQVLGGLGEAVAGLAGERRQLLHAMEGAARQGDGLPTRKWDDLADSMQAIARSLETPKAIHGGLNGQPRFSEGRPGALAFRHHRLPGGGL
jgi:hypothetical protein